MYESFEEQKNTKALSYTALICTLLIMFFIIYKWPIRLPAVPATPDLIEVNLGNEKEGRGILQPQVKGEPAHEIIKVSQKSSGANGNIHQHILTDEDKNQEAATITKEDKNKNKLKDIVAIPYKTKINITNNQVKVTSVPPKLKIPLYKGAIGTGGNGAQQDNGFRNQGYKSGNGDAGSPEGKLDSYGNTAGGRSGVSVVRGLSGRRPIHFPTMQDEFNENAKIYVDITVDANGIVTGSYIARGSTTSNSSLINIALQKARLLKFPASSTELERGTILFNFILKN